MWIMSRGLPWEGQRPLPVQLDICPSPRLDHGKAMQDATGLIRAKMEREGLSETAIKAFLFQYAKLVADESADIPETTIEPVDQLPRIEDYEESGSVRTHLSQTAVVKLNGGLGTSMGLEKAKSLLTVRGELTFLDIIVRQFLYLRQHLGPDLGLFLMNSFSTSADTRNALARYPELGDPASLELLQNKVPKIAVDSLAPIEWPQNPQLEWCPPGHGDIYTALAGSGLLQTLRARDTLYLFVSNSDNLGATLDLRLLSYFVESGAPFLMEVTRRTPADRKGGHLARRKPDGRLLLRESAQCPESDLEAFQDTNRHRYFNTNNLWVRLDVLETVLAAENGILPLPLIRNQKTVDPRDKRSPQVYQLETAMGAAIECFEGSSAVEVPRSRFAPVKTTSDLLAVRSDAYELDEAYRLELVPERHTMPPVVELSGDYKLVDALDEMLARSVPSLRLCEALKVEGLVRFSPETTLEGRVTVRNGAEQWRDLPGGHYANQTVEL
jgi:UTP--glucose-1-phosphate uridylyltransferase